MFQQFSGDSAVQVILILALFLWEFTWTVISMWKASKKHHVVWFVALMLAEFLGVNFFGILSILYIFFFSRIKIGENSVSFEKWERKSRKKEKSKPKESK